MAETVLTRNSGCASCPIRCERRVKVEGKEVKGPEYETLGLFGPNIDSDDLNAVLQLNYVCDMPGNRHHHLCGNFGLRYGAEENGG